MQHKDLLLRFNDKTQATAILGAIGIHPDALDSDCVFAEPTGETAEFEGEVITLIRPVSGYHVSLAWRGKIPRLLTPYLVSEGAYRRASAAGFGSGCFKSQRFSAALRDVKDL